MKKYISIMAFVAISLNALLNAADSKDSIESNSLRGGRAGIDKKDSIESKKQNMLPSLNMTDNTDFANLSPTHHPTEKKDSIESKNQNMLLSLNMADADSTSLNAAHRPTNNIDSIESKNQNTANRPSDKADSNTLKIQGVVTTANKYEALLSSINSSVQVATEKEIKNAEIKNSDELGSLFAGLQILNNGGIAFPMASLRGISSPDFYSTTLNLYVDGVPQAPNFIIQALGDVEQVELLRGPQGTLYGENSQAGLIIIRTKNPLKGNYANISLTGSRLYEDINAYIGHNLIKDTLWIKANLRYIYENGFITQGSKNLNTAQSILGGVSVYYQPFSNLLATLSYNFNVIPENKKTFYLTKTQYENGYKINVGAPSVDNMMGDCTDPSDPTSCTPNNSTLGNQNAVYSYNPFQKINAHSASLKLEYSLDSHILSSISAFNYAGSLANPYPIVQTDGKSDSGYFYNTTQFLEELRLDSEYDNGIKSSIGLYYKYLLVDNGMRGYIANLPNDFTAFGFRANWNTKEYVNTIAIFGDTSIPLGEHFDLGLGARYQYYHAKVDSPLSPGAGITEPFSNSKGWNIFNPRISIGYKLNEIIKLYIAGTQSTKAGGFAKFPYADKDEEPYNIEQVYSAELGSHLNFLDSRLRANVAAYYMYIQDRQTYAGTALNQSIVNVGDAFSSGVDFDIGYYDDRLQASLGINIGVAKYLNGAKNVGQVVIAGQLGNYDVRGQNLKYSPLLSLVANVDYNVWNVKNHRFYIGGNARFYTEQYHYDYDRSNASDDLKEKAYILLDLNMRYAYKNIVVKIFSQNSTNSRHAIYARSLGGPAYYIPANPWNIGVNISYSM
ncbi:TonB-dependent receptor [Helicobacter saguini]|nr:TonB-dependent receptor [Helicobacter saguini]